VQALTYQACRFVIHGNDARCVVCGRVVPGMKGLATIHAKCPHKPVLKLPQRGPGQELKKLLAGWPFRIGAKPNCSCNARARTMDEKGIAWCEANIDTIVGWLREEATKRRLPFVDIAGRLLVKRAIRNARKAAS